MGVIGAVVTMAALEDSAVDPVVLGVRVVLEALAEVVVVVVGVQVTGSNRGLRNSDCGLIQT